MPLIGSKISPEWKWANLRVGQIFATVHLDLVEKRRAWSASDAVFGLMITGTSGSDVKVNCSVSVFDAVTIRITVE